MVMLGLIVSLSPAVGWAQDDQPTLDELLEITPPQRAPMPDSDPESQPTPQVDPEVSRALSGSDPGDVFDQAVRQMGQAADRLDQYRDVGLKTQRLQQGIIEKLDQVIAMARQQQQPQSGSSGSSSSSGQAQQQQGGSARNTGQGMSSGAQAAAGQGASSGGASPGGRETANEVSGTIQSNRTEWGNLPARLRDELQQGINERFSSIYREMTGAYYRRLAEEGDEDHP